MPKRVPRDDTNNDNLYRLLVEQASDGIVIYDQQGVILEINPRALEMSGYTREDLIGRRVTDFIAPDDLEKTPLRTEALREGRPMLGERVLVRPDGSRLPVELSARMLSDGRIHVLVRDITERKRLESEIVRSRDFYLTLLEDFPALVWRAGADGKCDYFNRTWLNFTGRTLEQERGEGWVEGAHPDDRGRVVRRYREAFRERRSFTIEYRLRRHDGEYRWISDNGTPFNDLNGTFAGYLGACYDITEQKLADEKVRHLNSRLEQRVAERTTRLREANRVLRAEIAERRTAEERYRTLAHAVASVVWTTDPEGAFVTPQDEWERYTGQPWEQHKGWGWLEMVHPDDREMLLDIWQTTVAERSVYLAEARLWNAERGEYRYFVARAAPVLNRDGSIREWIGTIRDVHERKLVQQERDSLLQSEQEARLDAEAAVRTRDELLAIVSHDLKNPLAAIKGNSQLLWRRVARMGIEDGDQITMVLKRIDEAASRMNLLISDLMDFGRLQAGQSLTLQRRAVDLAALANNVAHELQNTTNTHHIKVEPQIQTLVGMWDGPRIEQVLSNLLSNAIKYSPGGGPITVTVYEREDGQAALAVSDQGLGIPPQDLPYIFEWFRRAHDTSGRISGAGIGLASARYIAREHGGDIEVESTPGEGSTFTIVLPIEPPAGPRH
jgi:PAS domain S-box-containing protein